MDYIKFYDAKYLNEMDGEQKQDFIHQNILLTEQQKYELCLRDDPETKDIVDAMWNASNKNVDFNSVYSVCSAYGMTLEAMRNRNNDGFSIDGFTANDTEGLFNLLSDAYSNDPLVAKDFKEEQKTAKTLLKEYFKNGGNIEYFKCKLAQFETFLKNEPDSKEIGTSSYNHLHQTYNMQAGLSEMKSPYDAVFELADEIYSLKKKAERSENAKDIDWYESQVERKEEELEEKCAKFDPYMLRNVVECKKEYEKELTHQSGSKMTFSNQYLSANQVELIARRNIKKLESEAE